MIYMDMHLHYEWIEFIFLLRLFFKNISPVFFMKSEIKWLDTSYTIFVFCNIKKLLQNTLEIFVIEILKEWAFLLCKNYVGYVILVKLRFFFHTF